MTEPQNHRNDILPTIPGIPRAAAFDLIISQAVAGSRWEDCCADIMKSYAITAADVKAEMKIRAQTLVRRPLAINALVMVPIAMVCDIGVPAILNYDIVFSLAAVFGVTVSQTTYMLWLAERQRRGIYTSRDLALRVGILGGLLLSCLLTGLALAGSFHLTHGIFRWLKLLPSALLPIALYLSRRTQTYLEKPRHRRTVDAIEPGRNSMSPEETDATPQGN